MKLTREFYEPKGVAPEVHWDVLIYRIDEPNGRILAMAFQGKRARPVWYYRFNDIARRDAYIDKFLAECDSRRKHSEEMREVQRKLDAQPNPIKPGDIIVNSWGYDQTNIDFYEAVKASQHFVWLRERVSRVANECGFMSDYVLPGLGFKNEKITKHKVRKYRDGVSVQFKFGGGSVWNGRRYLASYYA